MSVTARKRRRKRLAERPPAPLVRLGGRWWHWDEIMAPSTGVRPPAFE
jgi:hypothetical protein